VPILEDKMSVDVKGWMTVSLILVNFFLRSGLEPASVVGQKSIHPKAERFIVNAPSATGRAVEVEGGPSFRQQE